MKKMFKLLMCAAIVAAGFTACSEEVTPIDPVQPGGTDGPVVEGQSTNATFSFQLANNAGTKTVYPDNSDPQTVEEFRLLIFKTTDNTLEKDTVVPSGTSLTLQLISGPKRIFVYANGGITTTGTPPVATAPAYVETPATNAISNYSDINGIYRLVATATPPSPPTGYFSDVPNLHPLYPNSGVGNPARFFFSSTVQQSVQTLDAGVSAIDSQDPTNNNNIVIELLRPVAKIAITKSAASQPTNHVGTPLTKIMTRDSAGTITDVQYRFWSVNVGMYAFQNYVNGRIATPEYLPTSADDTITLKNYYARELGSGTAPANNYIVIANRAGTPGAGSYYYIPENNPSTKMKGNTTIAEVQATFIPSKYHYVKYDLTTYPTHAGVNYVAGTETFTVYPAVDDAAATPLYDMYQFNGAGVTGLLENTLFAGQDAIKLVRKITYHLLNPTQPPKTNIEDNAYTTISDTQIEGYFTKYTGGKAYYRLNLGKPDATGGTNDYTILRNFYYDAEITGFARIGENSPIKLITPVNEVLEGSTYLTVVITLRNWQGVEIGTDI
jgi:hypothetical protein